MSLFSWLIPSRKPTRAMPPPPDSSGLSRVESTRPIAPSRRSAPAPAANAQPANRKNERIARREMLYGVVREAMVRAGVLSSGYKFKVLSLEPHGRQFLVMVDVARGFGDDTSRLAEIEALIAQNAKARHGIVVTAVYWRMNEHVAVGAPLSRTGALRPPAPAQPAPVVQPIATAAPAVARPAPRPGHEPLHETEVEAFKRALAMGAAMPVAAAGAAGANPEKSYTLLTGYEDTEMTEGRAADGDLSGTQYGQLN